MIFNPFGLFEKHLSDEEAEKYEHMRQKREENDERLKVSLKNHLSAFNDGIIAIFITVIILEIPYPTNEAQYRQFLWSVLIFIVSFLVIADFWYENKRIFEAMKEVDRLIVLLNFFFLMSLAFIPVMTKWVFDRMNRYAAVNYGVTYLATVLLNQLLHLAVVRKRFQNHMHLFAKISFTRIGLLVLVNLILIPISWFFPNQAILLYVLLPVISFLRPKD